MSRIDTSAVTAFVGGVAQLIKLASADRNVLASMRKEAQAAQNIRGSVVETMLKSGAAAPDQRQACETALASHARTLELLKSAVERNMALKAKLDETIKQAEAEKTASLGSGVKEKGGSSGYDPLETPYIGRRTSQLSPADRILSNR